MLEEVVHCRAGQVKIFSDASDRQVGGASFKGCKVAWIKPVVVEEERGKSST